MSAYAVKQVSHEMLATCDRLAANGCAGTIAKDIQRFVGRLGQRLAKPLRIVVLGEFNAGKSTLVNTLIGSELLPTSIHANTRVPILVHYTSKPQLSFEANDRSLQPISLSAVGDLRYGTARMLRVGLPVDRLKSLELVDTPGLATGSARLRS
ncbi:MAG: dynamin family protein, partial [Hyphomicrobiaceae bacterium]